MSNARLAQWQSQIAAWGRDAARNKFFVRGIIAACVIAIIDQLSKYWIVYGINLPAKQHIEVSGLFDLTYVQNYGASFGMLAGGTGSRVLLATISTAVATGLAVWLGRLTRPIAAIGVALIIGGALGNLVDRVWLGYVVDFLDFSAVPFPNFERTETLPFFKVFIGGFIWVFNIADAAINVGVAFLLIDAWQTRNDSLS